MAIFRQRPFNWASNAGGIGKNRDSPPISGFITCCQRCNRLVLYIQLQAPDRGKLETLIAGTRRRLLFTGDDDEVFVTMKPQRNAEDNRKQEVKVI